MKKVKAEIVREYGPFPGVNAVHGVSYNGKQVWFASGDKLNLLDTDSGQVMRSLNVPAVAGTAYDGEHLFQIDGERINKLDPESGRVLATIPAPEGGAAGMAWAEGSLWVGQYRNRKIHQVDPATGKILKTLECNRFVTGVTWAGNELWHGTWENEESELRHIDPKTGEVISALDLPEGNIVTGLESDGGDLFYCGGGSSGKVRAVRRPVLA
jgi:outer membrane protein assembly factor BamB